MPGRPRCTGRWGREVTDFLFHRLALRTERCSGHRGLLGAPGTGVYPGQEVHVARQAGLAPLPSQYVPCSRVPSSDSQRHRVDSGSDREPPLPSPLSGAPQSVLCVTATGPGARVQLQAPRSAAAPNSWFLTVHLGVWCTGRGGGVPRDTSGRGEPLPDPEMITCLLHVVASGRPGSAPCECVSV